VFDETSATLTGQATALPDRVVPLSGPAWLPVSVGAETIAYWSGDGRPTFDVDVVDRSGRAIQQVLPPGQYLGLDLSPDGSRALVTERIDSQTDALYLGRVPEEGGNALLQPPVRVPRLRVEPDAAPVDAVPPSLLLLADIPGERLFGFAEVDDDAIDIRGHAASLRS